ncbi:hypothetical protein HMPREF1531_00740 [Propionibacterium sp. oral taxon 192 str. F0372]|nr:hypothetical protein HMPREF1531_00740 [Propionibacterium sp. oral taxon 192 str. F0372]
MSRQLDEAACDKTTKWGKYLNNLLQRENCPPSNTRFIICPVCAGGVELVSDPLKLMKKKQAIWRDRESIGLDIDYDKSGCAADVSDRYMLSLEVGHVVARQVTNESNGENDLEPLKVFISHTRQLGSDAPDVAELVRKELQRTRLGRFFDAESIQTTTQWKEKIDSEASKRALLVVRTDHYSKRRWTQREVRLAKQNEVPIVALSALSSGDQYGCFMLDNVPTIPFPAFPVGNADAIAPQEEDADAIAHEEEDADVPQRDAVLRALLRLVDECLKKAVWEYTVEAYVRANFDWVSLRAPEPTTIMDWLQKKKRLGEDRHLWVLHPDPPITSEEWEILREMSNLAGFKKSKLTIVTPRELDTRGGSLQIGSDPQIPVSAGSLCGVRIGISASMSDDLRRMGMDAMHMDSAVAELARHVFVQGGTLVYGGRLFDEDKPHDLMLVLGEEAKRYGNGIRDPKEGSDETEPDDTGCRPVFENFFAWSKYSKEIADRLDVLQDRFYPDVKFFVADPDGNCRDLDSAREVLFRGDYPAENHPNHECLTKMREVLIKESDIQIVMGGRFHHDDKSEDKLPGILEEVWMAVKAGKPLYIAGGFGGVSRVIAERLGLTDKTWLSRERLSKKASEVLDELEEYWKKGGQERTGLNDEDLGLLATTSRPSIIMRLVLKGQEAAKMTSDNKATEK